MKHLLLTISLFALLTCFVNTANALTIEQQLKPYPELKNYKTKDIMDLINFKPEYEEDLTKSCNTFLNYLFSFYFCMYEDKPTSKYVLISKFDASGWKVLQKFAQGILINVANSQVNPIIMIEGNFNVFDGQPFSKKHYLLKYDGTFEYTSAIGTTKTVPKLKLLTEIKTN